MVDASEEDQSLLPFAELAPSSRGPTLLLGAIAIIAMIIPITSALCLSQGMFVYRAGRENLDPPFVLARGEGILLYAWMAGIAVLACGSFWRMRKLNQKVFRAALLLCIASTPIACAFRKLPDESYIAGFSGWAKQNVNLTAIQQWQASLPPVTAATPVAPSRWPDDIRSLAPAVVEQLPHGQGITLQWGRLGTWGTSRKIFVAPDTSIGPPNDDLHPWVQVAPGFHVSLQIRT